MRNTRKLLGLAVIAVIALNALLLTACPDSGGGPQTATYTGSTDGTTYTLKITEAARYAAQSGDDYELTVETKKSVGKVESVAGGVLTLKPSNATDTFKATVSGSSLTKLEDTITWTDYTTANAPGALTGGGSPPGGGNQTPAASDFSIGNLNQTAGSVTAVTITPKQGKSQGQITIYYNGSRTLPSAVGTYPVTFDVAAATGWNSANGLSAGTLTISSSSSAFTSIAAFSAWLSSQPANNAATAYTAKLDVSDLGGSAETSGSLGAALFANNTKYVYLDLSGSTITTIPAYALNYYYDESIDEAEYIKCTTLTGIIIPNSVTSIGNNTFANCTGLTSITIPSGVTSIGWAAFWGCTSLTSVTINNSVIGGGMFASCTSLTSVTIPNSVTSIGQQAFGNCTSLTSVTLPTNPNFTSIEVFTFLNCTSLTSVTIPNSVTSIDNFAFQYCTSLTSITIPNSVTSIGWWVFSGCTSLTSVTFEGTISADCLGPSWSSPFEGDLKDKYLAGGIGTYTRPNTGEDGTWTKVN